MSSRPLNPDEERELFEAVEESGYKLVGRLGLDKPAQTCVANSSCISLVAEKRREGEPAYCPEHLRRFRLAAERCPNCGGAEREVPEINALTQKQLRRGGELVFALRCEDCSRQRRPRPKRRQR